MSLPMSRERMLPFLAAMGFFLLLGGCDDACTALGKKICDCEVGDVARQQCVARVESRATNDEPSRKEQEVCEGYLDSCTCDALEEGRIEACGLAKSP